MSRTVVAFCGLGQMGAPMARRLAAAGYGLRVYDRSLGARRRFETMRGVVACESAADAASGAKIVVTMLPDGRATAKVLLGRDGAAHELAARSLVIDMSSSDPADTAKIGVALAARKIDFMDAPVSGRVDGARDGTLTIMAGGEQRVLRRARPILEHLGTTIFHAGPLGAGHLVKALNNYIAAAGTIAAFEATIIGRARGLDPRVLVDIWNASAGRNSTTQNKIKQHVLSGAFASGFALGLMAKDVRIAARAARSAGRVARSLALNAHLWTGAERALTSAVDHTRIYRYLESISGPRDRSRSARQRR